MSLSGRLGKLRGRSLAEFRERLGQKLAAQFEARGLSPNTRLLDDAGLAVELQLPLKPGALHVADSLRAHFASRSTPAFFPGIRDGTSAGEMRTPRWSGEAHALVKAADRILAGRYDLLGHADLSFGSPIDWHFDPTTGRRSPMAHWSRIPYLDANVIGDHKVVWEINRHQHFFVLGRAYQVSGQEAYAAHFAHQVSSWMDANPPKRGVNWASSLEVAYRSIAWLWALELFRDAPALSPDVLSRMLKHLHANGKHLERYLSTYFSPNTHLTGEALGLLYLGLLLPELKRSVVWRRVGWEILEHHLPRQVSPDGVYFEQATYYHRYTADIYLHAVMLAARNGISVPPAMRSRLDAAVSHLADLTRPDGSIPVIGDDDGGRLVVLEERDGMDVRAVLGIAAVELEHPAFATVAGQATEEVLWMLGPDGVRAFDAAAAGDPPAHLSRVFADGGYAVLRDGWGPNARHAVIDGGPLGTMNCGHAHSDALSIEVFAGGRPILVDPGTFTYTVSPELRDHFRHSAAHNTVTVDGESASVPNGPFSWQHRANASIEQWWSGPGTDRFVGSHAGFQRLADPVIHRRTVLFARHAYWVIVDSVAGNAPHESTAHFHAAIGATVERVSPLSVRITPSGAPTAPLLLVAAGDVDALDMDQDWVSDSYGRKRLAPRMRATGRGAGRRDLVTVLVPVPGDARAAVRELKASSGRAMLVELNGLHDLILLPAGGPVSCEGVEFRGEMGLVRRGAAGTTEMVALFGSDATLTTDGMRFHATGAAEMVRTSAGWAVVGQGRVESATQRPASA